MIDTAINYRCQRSERAAGHAIRRAIEHGIASRDEIVVCVITGHQLKAPHPTVAYHSLHGPDFEKEFGAFGVTKSPFANSPIPVKNDLQEILKALD